MTNESDLSSGTESQNENQLWSEGVLIALLTIASYALAYWFESGYAAYFHLPFDFIKVSLDMCLRASVGVLGYVTVIATTLGPGLFLINKGMKGTKPGLRSTLLRLFIPILIIFQVLKISLNLPPSSWIFFLILCAILAGPNVVRGLFSWYKSSENRTLDEHIRAAVHTSTGVSLLSRVERMVGRRRYWFVGSLFILLSLGYLAGNLAARSNQLFLITGDFDRILLRNYGDVYVFKNFDKSTNTIGTEVSVLNLDEVAKLTLKEVILKSPTVASGEEMSAHPDKDRINP